MHFLDQLDLTTIVDVADSSEIARLEAEIAELNVRISRTEEQITKLVDKLLTLDTPAAALNKRLLELEATVAEDKKIRELVEKQLAEAKHKHHDLLDRSVLYASLSKAKDIETRSRLRQEIRRKVSRIELHFGLDGWFCVADVNFVKNVIRGLIFTANGETLILKGQGGI